MAVQDFYVKQYARMLGDSKLYSMVRFFVRKLANLHVAMRFGRPCSDFESRIADDVIVSLTSFPARIDKVWIVIECLMRQSLRPSKIILWLSKLQFTEDSIPESLKKMKARGLEIRLVDDDIRSYKKFYYAFKEFPDKRIVLVDDDIIYPSYFIKELYDKFSSVSTMENKVLVCRYGQHMGFTKEGKLIPYNRWRSDYGESEDRDFFFGTGGGTMIVPSYLHKDTLDIELAQKLAPTADDIWLNAMCRLAGCSIHKIADKGPLLPVINKEDKPLSSINVTNRSNDTQIKNVIDYYADKLSLNPFKN